MRGLRPRRLKMKSQKAMDKKAIIIIGIVAAVLVVLGVILGVSLADHNNGNTIQNEIQRIYISKAPNKTQFYVDDEPDYTGLELQIVRNNGKIENIVYSDSNSSFFTFSGFNSKLPEEKQTITVTYKGYSASFNISIVRFEPPADTIKSISWVKLPKTEYKVGDFYETNGGMLLKEYNDGTTERCILLDTYVLGREAAFVNGRAKNIGTYELTVKYKENGVTVYTTYTITVTE